MLFDRLFHSLLGVLFGAAWGVALAWLLTSADWNRPIALAGAVFAAFGLIFGRFVIDLCEAALYLLCGLLEVLDTGCDWSAPSTVALLKAMVVLGMGTGIVLLLVLP